MSGHTCVVDLAGVCSGPGPCDTTPFGTGDNWVNRVGGLPLYIRAVAKALRRSGHSESSAIATAVATVKRWAAGDGGVTPETRARAAAALAEWERKKAQSHALTAGPTTVIDLADSSHVYHWKHGWIPITPHAALQKAHGSHAGAARILHGNGQHEDAQRMLAHGLAASKPGSPARVRYRTALAHHMSRHGTLIGPNGAASTSAVDMGSGIHIEHTGDGTLVHGTSRNDGSAAVLKQQGFRWSSNLNAWYLPRNQHFSTRGAKVDNAERDLKAAGHDVTVTREAASTTSAAEREAAARARATDRAGRMDTRAANAAREAGSRRAASDRITDQIPMGQPILVGHHSEGRHRRDIARAHSNMEKSWEADRQAKESQAAAERARATAAGDSPLLRQRRIDRNEAEIRKIDKTLAQHDIAVKKPEAAARFGVHPLAGTHLEQLRASRAELADQVAHDKAQIAASGHKTFTAADLKPGDLITYRGRTHVVKKVNKTTISVPTGYSWDDKVPINQITGHKPHADLPPEAQAKAKQIASLTAAPTATIDLSADPVFSTNDGPNLTIPAGSHQYRHGWIRIDAAAPTAVERATRAAITDGHAMLHGAGMVPAAQKVIERMKAAGHTPTVKRVDVAGTPHLHIAKRGGSSDYTAAPATTVDLAFTEQLHPRAPKGAAGGGRFAAKNSASAPPADMAANVRDFQRRMKLPVTGVVDTATAAKIRAELASKGGSRRKGRGGGKTKARKAAAAARRQAKAATRAQKQQLAQHVATVNSMTPAQRAAARNQMPVPPTGYVWTPTNTLRRFHA